MIPVVVGSNPIVHPISRKLPVSPRRISQAVERGNIDRARQALRQLPDREARPWMAAFTCRDAHKHGPLAQLVEQETLNLLVLGSSPRRPTIFYRDPIREPRSRKPCRAKVAELVDALDLGSSGVTRESSSLSFRTTFE